MGNFGKRIRQKVQILKPFVWESGQNIFSVRFNDIKLKKSHKCRQFTVVKIGNFR